MMLPATRLVLRGARARIRSSTRTIGRASDVCARNRPLVDGLLDRYRTIPEAPPGHAISAAQLWVLRQLINISKELIEGSRRRVGQGASGSLRSACPVGGLEDPITPSDSGVWAECWRTG